MDADDQTEFMPGERIRLLLPPKPATPAHHSVHLELPGRIHISPIDCNRFALGAPGGGGLGFAVRLANALRVTASASLRTQAPPCATALLRHYMTLCRAIFAYEGSFDVTLELMPELSQHCGLGSSAIIATACVQAVNILMGSPLRPNEVRTLVGHNFVEQVGAHVSRGLETGVGTYVALHGGIALIGDRLVPLYSSSALDGTPALLVFPAATRPEMDRPESMDMLTRSRQLDASYRYIRAYRMIMELVPALDKGDLVAAGNVIWDFQFSGTHQSMIQAYDDGGLEIIRIMTLLRRAGCEIVGMSSVGPLIYALSSDIKKLEKLAQSLTVKCLLSVVSGGLQTLRTEAVAT